MIVPPVQCLKLPNLSFLPEVLVIHKVQLPPLLFPDVFDVQSCTIVTLLMQ